MTKYLSPSPFTVPMSGNQTYRDNYDAIDWGNKDSAGRPEKVESATIQQQVLEFHETYGQPVADKLAVPNPDRVLLRLQLIGEELCELLEACGIEARGVRENFAEAIENPWDDVDIVAVADALGDLAYVIEGMNLEFGIHSAAVLAEIHRSNMSKLGDDGKPIYFDTGKVLKGPNYSPPNLEKVLGLE